MEYATTVPKAGVNKHYSSIIIALPTHTSDWHITKTFVYKLIRERENTRLGVERIAGRRRLNDRQSQSCCHI